jgi:membrane protease YdiL (CAAX protease family)
MEQDARRLLGSVAQRERIAKALRGFGPFGLIAILLIIFAGNPASGVLVLVWAWASETPWRDIGYVRPTSWIRSTVVGIVLGVALKLTLKSVVMPLLGADPINHAYHYLVGNRAALPGVLFAVIVGAGFSEETVFRGFMFERFGRLFGHSVRATTAIVLLTSTWFAVAHYPDQGIDGVKQAACTGLVFGSIFAVTGQLWTMMVAHAAFDVTAVAMIYLDRESAIAHVFFK